MKPNHARHTTIAVFAALTLVLPLAACSSDDTGVDGPIELTQLDGYTDATSNKAWQKILDDCATETGVTIKRQNLPTKEMMKTILRQASAKEMSNLIFVDNPNLQQIAATGAIAELDTLGLNTDGYYPGIAEAGTYEGKTYGIAPGVNALALFYNKKLFTDAGLQPPTTWDELRSTAKALTQDKTYGLSMSLLPTEEGTWQFLPFYWGAGAELTNLASTEAVEALEYVNSVLTDGSMSKSVLNWNQAEAGDQFMAGQAAMTISGSWSVANFSEQTDVDWGIVPLPGKDGKAAPVALGGEVGMISRSDPAKEKASAEVLKCMTSSKNQQYWAAEHAYIPGLSTAAEQYADSDEVMRPFVEAVATARPRTSDLADKYPAASTALINAVQQTLTGKSDAAAALKEAQDAQGDNK